MYKFEWWKEGQCHGSYHCGDPKQADNEFQADSIDRGLRIGFHMLNNRPANTGATIWFEDLK